MYQLLSSAHILIYFTIYNTQVSPYTNAMSATHVNQTTTLAYVIPSRISLCLYNAVIWTANGSGESKVLNLKLDSKPICAAKILFSVIERNAFHFDHNAH